MVSKNVVAPAPSRCAKAPISTVPITTSMTRPRVIKISRRITGSNSPASDNMPKKMIAKMNITTTFITWSSPELKNDCKSPTPKPSTMAPTVGTRAMATTGETLPQISSPTVTAIMANPAMVRTRSGSVVIAGFLSKCFVHHKSSHRFGIELSEWSEYSAISGLVLEELWQRATTVQPPLPQSWVLAVGIAALLVTWTPFGYRIVRHLATVLHEAGHALVAALVGRKLRGIRVHADISGLTVSKGRPTGPGMVATLLAGYPAPAVVGLAGAWLISHGYAAGTMW